MTPRRETLFQLFKYLVYSLLAVNVYVFLREEYLAALIEFPGGVPFGDIIDAYATTIDTAAWLVLLLMFELETYVLGPRHSTPPAVTRTLHGLRIASYVFIVYAFYGYTLNAVDTYDVAVVAGLDDLCTLAGNAWMYAVDYDEYVAITAANCADLSPAGSFLRFAELPAVVDAAGLGHIRLLAWADASNALVWILIVVILEIEVRLQEHDRLTDAAVRVMGVIKVVFYSILFLLAIYWGFDGDFVDFWDAFLWLVAFFFIELNVIEWRHEEDAEDSAPAVTSA
ncbi:MAG TPA: hypothetical protein VFY03_00275 [Woeseiaceae bacterium]|nr:hypothetical protein [Woeseiaceae bacterium]